MGGSVRRAQTFKNINVVTYYPTLPPYFTPHFPTIGVEDRLDSFFPNGTTATTIKKSWTLVFFLGIYLVA